MMNRYRIGVLALSLFVCALGAATTTAPGSAVTDTAGDLELKYDDGLRYAKLGYPANGQGWGVKFCPCPHSESLGGEWSIPQVETLTAGQVNQAGTVSVMNSGDTLVVTYHTWGGWKMEACHLFVDTTKTTVPVTQPGNTPIPGQFPYVTVFSPEVTDFTYRIPLGNWPAGARLYILAHATLNQYDPGGNLIQHATSWAGDSIWPSNRWAYYFTYYVREITPPEPCWVKLKEVKTNLCPPPPGDASYKEEIRVYLADGPDEAPGTLVYSKVYDVRIGEWWHYILIEPDLWLRDCFYVFTLANNGYQSLYQWFDGHDDSPTGTQWYFNGTDFTQYTNPNVGDIEIRAQIEAHDVGVVSITSPGGTINPGTTITPTVLVKNYAPFVETAVPVRFWIVPEGGGNPVHDATVNVNFPDNTTPFAVVFPSAVLNATGRFVMHSRTLYEHECGPSNDEVTAGLVVYYVDAAASALYSPAGEYALDDIITPQAMVANNGSQTATFPATMTFVGTTYSNTQTVIVGAGSSVLVTFANWTPTTTGTFTARCAVALSGDMNPANDVVSAPFTITPIPYDIGPTAVVSPPASGSSRSRYTLDVTFYNFGTRTVATAPVYCQLVPPSGPVENFTNAVTNLAPLAAKTVRFANSRLFAAGTWQLKTWSALAGDIDRTNDTFRYTFVMSSGLLGWNRLEPMPGNGKTNKGAALATDNAGTIYLLNGRYDPKLYIVTGEPDVGAEELPASLEKPGHGAAMTWSDGALYVLAGENRTAFYSYAPATDVWTARADVPVNSDERGPRAGAGMVAVNGLVYLLKGNSTRDLLVYDPTQDVWSAAPSVPAGVKGTSVRTGGALATDGSRLYVVKGSGREFYTLHLASGTWQQLADLPVKARVGTVLTCVEGVVYAVFGGTWLSYRYDRDLDSWVRLEDVPFGADGRKVAVGAAAAGAGDCFLFEKGRKTSELWFYVPGEPVFGSEPGRANPMTAGGLTVNAQWRPVNPAGTRLAVPVRSPSRIRLYNAGGALVRAVDAGTPVELDLQGIGHGVYLLKITDNSGTLTRSVVVGN